MDLKTELGKRMSQSTQQIFLPALISIQSALKQTHKTNTVLISLSSTGPKYWKEEWPVKMCPGNQLSPCISSVGNDWSWSGDNKSIWQQLSRFQIFLWNCSTLKQNWKSSYWWMQKRKKTRQNSRSCLEIKKNQRGTGSEKDSSISRIIPEFNECKRQMRCKNKINQKV